MALKVASRYCSSTPLPLIAKANNGAVVYTLRIGVSLGHTDGEWPKETPILRVYTTAPLLALAISGRGVDEQYLEATFRAISNVYPIPSRLPTNLQGWSIAKDA